LYPAGAPSAARLELYSRVFDSVEIDSTFYAMPPAERFRSWYDRTPAGFTFAVKLPRAITHDARLVAAETLLLDFCDRAAELREKLGPLLIQLPPGMGTGERSSVEKFLPLLPRELAFAIEFRAADWFDEQTYDLLRTWSVTLAVSVGPWLSSTQALRIARTAPGGFGYFRFMATPRHQPLIPTIIQQRDDELAAWAEFILGRDQPAVYAYFNNDYQGHSPESARRLQRLLGLTPADPSLLHDQRDLFG
jgi:uncharacterized protein YecE (DUF72 family)